MLALVAGGAQAAGTAVDPLATESAPGGHDGTSGAEDTEHGDTHSGTVAEAEQKNDQPGGLASSRGGYTVT